MIDSQVTENQGAIIHLEVDQDPLEVTKIGNQVGTIEGQTSLYLTDPILHHYELQGMSLLFRGNCLERKISKEGPGRIPVTEDMIIEGEVVEGVEAR